MSGEGVLGLLVMLVFIGFVIYQMQKRPGSKLHGIFRKSGPSTKRRD